MLIVAPCLDLRQHLSNPLRADASQVAEKDLLSSPRRLRLEFRQVGRAQFPPDIQPGTPGSRQIDVCPCRGSALHGFLRRHQQLEPSIECSDHELAAPASHRPLYQQPLPAPLAILLRLESLALLQT